MRAALLRAAGAEQSVAILLRLRSLAPGAICRPRVQEGLEFVDRREEIVHVLAFAFQIPCNPPGVRNRLLRKPLPRFLSEFCRVGPFHSSACHRSIPSDNCQPETLSPVLSAIVTANEVLTNDRLSKARRPLAISISH